MAPADDDARWQRVQQVLETCFLAMERGEPLELVRRCEGDETLLLEVTRLLQSAPSVMLGPSELAAEPAMPRSFGDFDLLRAIGRGGMGRVYLANQRSLSRQVAVKLLDQASSAVPGAPLRLRREAELTALLDHPNIVPVYAVGEVGGVPYIAMKYLGGPSFAEFRAPMAPERVARYGAALAHALEAAHLQGIVHRDVKPANVLLDGDVPVFVDFGLARSQADPTLTQAGKVAGTLRYMAPERFDGRLRTLDPRVDVYGLGATLYELLGARPPFEDDNPTALVRSVLTREPSPLRLSGRHHDLETIVLRAMAKEPERRFATAAAMAEDLERYLAGRPVLSRRLSLLARFHRLTRRHPRVSAATLVAVLLLVGLALALLWQDASARADRSRRLDLARADLEHHRHAHAAADLALLAAHHAQDHEVAAWLARARAEVAIDELFLAVTDRSSNVPPNVLADLEAAAGESSGAAAAATAFARVLATRHVRGAAAARDCLTGLPAEWRRRRCGEALAAWCADAALPWTLSAAPDDQSADEAVLTAAVLRLAGAEPDEVLRELTAPGVGGAARHRRLFLEAIVRADGGDLAGALQLLRGLADDDSHEAVWRWVANLHNQLGQIDAAARALQRASHDRSPAAQYLRLVIAKAGRDEALFAPLLAAAAAAAPAPPEVERFLAEHAGLQDSAAIPAALERLERLAASQRDDRIGRDLTVAVAAQLAASQLPTRTHAAADGYAPDRHRQFAAQWRLRCEALRYRPALALAQPWLARSLCHTDEPADLLAGLELFAAVCRRAPTSAAAAVLYAETVADLPAAVDRLVRVAHTRAARSALAAVEAAAGAGLCLSAVETQFVTYYALVLALQADDAVEVAARLPAVEELVDEALLPKVRQAAADAHEALARMRRR